MTRDFSVVAWGATSEVTITHQDGLTSDEWPLQSGGGSSPGPSPGPGPAPFSDSLGDFQQWVSSQGITASYDSTVNSCVTQLKQDSPFNDAKTAVWISTDCADTVTV